MSVLIDEQTNERTEFPTWMKARRFIDSLAMESGYIAANTTRWRLYGVPDDIGTCHNFGVGDEYRSFRIVDA